MYSITVRNNILIAHSLPGEVFGPAQNMHGATYIVDAEFYAKEVNKYNIIMDLGVVTEILSDVLKFYSYKNLDEIGLQKGTDETTFTLAKLGKELGIDGIVASLDSVSEIKRNFGNDFLTVTPGIRMQQSNDDQKRSGSLFDAIQFGSDFVVVGRELTQASNKDEVVNQFNSLIA